MKIFPLIILPLCSLTLCLAEEKDYYNTKDHVLNRPIGGLDDFELDEFFLGRSFFTIPWVVAPSVTTARDGLGPLFNANTCTSCHRGNGLGEIYNEDGNLSRALVTKLSRKSGKPVPFYGKQIAVNGTFSVPFEAMPKRTNTPVKITYPDGREVTLQKPTYSLTNLQYGDLPDDIIIVQRRAPALVGLGLTSQIDKDKILSNADPYDKDNDGISGRPNWVITASGKRKLGIYTAKASVATVREQTADALVNDMGLTNPVFKNENCTPEQTECLNAPKGRPDQKGRTVDVTKQRLNAITAYMKHSRVPISKLDKQEKRGKSLFVSTGCSSCHLPKVATRKGKFISPYSDFLLHDMGEGLNDNRVEFEATGREFRTAPLWGVSTYAKNLRSGKPHYLHDGRAETIEQAILWHGGEAKHIKEKFMSLPKADREAIIAFVESL